MCVCFRIEIGGVVVEISRQGEGEIVSFFIFFIYYFIFLSPPNSYFIRIGLSERLGDLNDTSTFVVQIST